jgi:hypothetical protein
MYNLDLFIYIIKYLATFIKTHYMAKHWKILHDEMLTKKGPEFVQTFDMNILNDVYTYTSSYNRLTFPKKNNIDYWYYKDKTTQGYAKCIRVGAGIFDFKLSSKQIVFQDEISLVKKKNGVRVELVCRVCESYIRKKGSFEDVDFDSGILYSSICGRLVVEFIKVRYG